MVAAPKSKHQFKLRVLGEPEVIAQVVVAGLVPAAAEVLPGEEQRDFVAALGDWDQAFVARLMTTDAGAPPGFEIAPWLCLGIDEAESVADGGGSVTESRTIEVDRDGTFWSNGRYGQAFASSCQWSTAERTVRGVAALQNGPCLCNEADRQGTSIQVIDGAGDVVATPVSCVAFSSSLGGGQVGIVFDSAGSSEGMTFAVTHCVSGTSIEPFRVTAAELRSADCAWEGATLSFGQPAAEKPRVLDLVDGAWDVTAASELREGRHLSTVDLQFEREDGVLFRVVGSVDLPQVLQ